MSRTAAKFLDYDGLVQYTGKVKKLVADSVGETTDENVIQESDSGSTALPVILAGSGTPNSNTATHVKYDSAINVKPSAHMLTIKNGNNEVQITHQGYVVTDGTNTAQLTASSFSLPASATPEVYVTAGTASNAPKISVEVGGQRSTAAELTKASDSAYGAVKTTSDYGNSTDVVPHQKLVTSAAGTVMMTAKSDNNSHPILVSNDSSLTSGSRGEAGYDTALSYNPSTDTLLVESTNPKIEVHTTGQNSVSTEVGAAGIQFKQSGSSVGYVSAQGYSGNALGTEEALANTTSGHEGATLIGYGTSTVGGEEVDVTVKDALDDLYATVGGGGETSLASRVTTLEGKTTNLTETQFNGNASTATTATNLANNPVVTLSSASSSGGQTITVTAGGKSGTSGAIANASSSVYGVVKLATYSSDPSDTTNNAFVPTLGVVKSLISDLNTAQFVVTNYASPSSLPTLTAANFGTYSGKIYLIKSQDYGDVNNNIYDEYIAVEVIPMQAGQSVEYKWELLGTTDAGVDVVSLTESEINTIWSTTAAAS